MAREMLKVKEITRNGYRYDMKIGRYLFQNNLCIIMEDKDENYFAITRNPEIPLPKNMVMVDTNNSPFAIDLIKDIAKDSGKVYSSGYCKYPIWILNNDILENAPMVPDIGKATLKIPCISCGKEVSISFDEKQIQGFYDYMDGKGDISKCLGFLSPGEREMFLSQICNHCFAKL